MSESPATTEPAGTSMRLPWYGRLGHLLNVLGLLGAIAMLAMPAQILRLVGASSGTPWGYGLSIIVAGLGGYVVMVSFRAIGVVLHRRALRTLASNASEVLNLDPRPPVLYLRSFDDETRYVTEARWMTVLPAVLNQPTAERERLATPSCRTEPKLIG